MRSYWSVEEGVNAKLRDCILSVICLLDLQVTGFSQEAQQEGSRRPYIRVLFFHVELWRMQPGLDYSNWRKSVMNKILANILKDF